MTEVPLIKRECNECGHEAVPLDGIGTDCVDCSGEYVARTGVQVVDVDDETAEGFREYNPDAVAE